jgi:hypothetical protein
MLLELGKQLRVNERLQRVIDGFADKARARTR